MPEVSRFFGIVIRRFAEAGGVHHLAHFHAYYQEQVGIYGVDQVERLAGPRLRDRSGSYLPWAEIHQNELRRNWEALQGGRPPSKIEPLR